MFRQFLCKTYHNDIQQIQITFPFIRTDQVFFGKMNMAHGVFLHIHTNPNRIDTFNVIVTRILEISFLLGRNQSAYIEYCPVQDLIFAGFILLCQVIIDSAENKRISPYLHYNLPVFLIQLIFFLCGFSSSLLPGSMI